MPIAPVDAFEEPPFKIGLKDRRAKSGQWTEKYI